MFLHFFIKSFSTSQRLDAGQKWRLMNGLARIGNEYGPLTETPDWSYLDGRSSPLNEKEARRRLNSKNMAETAVRMVGEMQEAQSRWRRQQAPQKRLARHNIYLLNNSKAQKERY